MKVGFLAGSFDVLHPGYILMFEEAKSLCDELVVGLNSCRNLDDSSKISPILSVEDRKKRLLALRYVDKVFIYHSEEQLETLLKALAPDIRFLGDDYKSKSFTGMELNIPIHFMNRSHGWSTTKYKKMIASQISNI